MTPGIFQRAAEFDRYDGEMRRTYLAVDPGGRLVIANLREQPAITLSDIASAPNRCTSVGPWSPVPTCASSRRTARPRSACASNRARTTST